MEMSEYLEVQEFVTELVTGLVGWQIEKSGATACQLSGILTVLHEFPECKFHELL